MKRGGFSGGALLFLFVGLAAGTVSGAEAIPNWTAPATWTPSKTAGGVHTMTDVTSPLPFVGVTPCRVADTRGNGFTGAYGPPSLVANADRNFTIVGQCGIPNGASAVSFNFAALNVGGAGDLRVFPAGGTVPLVSTMNYNANTPNIANAAVVPLGSGGAITVRADAVAVDLIIDVNGYYASAAANQGNTFEVDTLAPWAITGKTGSSNALATGVLGQAWASTGNTIGVWGETFSTTDGARGVMGFAQGGTAGKTYGVQGLTLSITNHAAGGYFEDGVGVVNTTGAGSFSAGVVGHGRNGVVGRTSTASGDGLIGVFENAEGIATADGRVGAGTHAFLAEVGDYAGPSPSITVDPHPTNASVVIAYPSLTGNEAGTYFRGTAQTTDREFVINVPEDFRMVTDSEGLTVQLTPVGAPANMYVVSEDLNRIVVRSSRDVKFHYLIQGVRVGHKGYNPVQDSMSYGVFLPQTADGLMRSAWPDYIKQRLIRNGTYNEDGTVNLETAERLGWAKAWREGEEQAKAAAAADRAARQATNVRK